MRTNRFLSAVAAAGFLVAAAHVAAVNVASAAIDVSLVTPEDFAAIVIHPRQICECPLVADQLKDATVAAAIRKFGVEPGEVEEIVVLLSIDEDPEPVATLVARFTHDVDAKELLAKLRAVFAPGRESKIEQTIVGGKTCLDLDGGLAFAADSKTIVLSLGAGRSLEAIRASSRKHMKKLLAVAAPQGPFVERLKAADSDLGLLVAVAPQAFPDLDKIIDGIKRQSPALVANYLTAAKTVRGGTISFRIEGRSTLRVSLDTADAEAANNLTDLLEQSLRMASGGLAVARQAMPKEQKATFDPLLKLADQFLDGGKVQKSGSQVTLDFQRPAVLDTAGPQIVNAIRRSVVEARTAARRTQQMNNMRQVSIAMLVYETQKGYFPPAAIEKEGKPPLSWRVAILPYLGEQDIYNRFHLDEPWDGPHNLPLSKIAVPFYQSVDGPADGTTRIMVFTGKGAAFDGGKKFRSADIRDGLSNTILCAEAGPDKAVPWSKPEDLPFDPEKPLAALGNISARGFPAAFLDGHVGYLKVDNVTLKALITPDGGEVIDPAKLTGK